LGGCQGKIETSPGHTRGKKMKNKEIDKKPSHISKRNVIDDLGFSPEETVAIKLKASLHAEIIRLVEKRKLKSQQLEKILDQPQTRISELLNGKISKIRAEKLAGYLSRLGLFSETRSNR
jgi:predicted XRE-type DNA-binding protein